MDQRAVAKVVQATVLEDLGTSLEPHGLTELHAVLGQQLGGHAAQGAKHGPTGMDDLKLTVAAEGLGISGQTSGIPAIVTGELAGQVAGDSVLGEGTKPLGAVGAIELNALATAGSSLLQKGRKAAEFSNGLVDTEACMTLKADSLKGIMPL